MRVNRSTAHFKILRPHFKAGLRHLCPDVDTSSSIVWIPSWDYQRYLQFDWVDTKMDFTNHTSSLILWILSWILPTLTPVWMCGYHVGITKDILRKILPVLQCGYKQYSVLHNEMLAESTIAKQSSVGQDEGCISS